MRFKSSLVPNPQLKLVNKFGNLNSTIPPQTGIARKKLSVTDWQEKASAVVKALGLPVQVIASPNYSLTRKPCPGRSTQDQVGPHKPR